MATNITNTSITTDNLTVDTNTFHVDSSNNRVGINKTTPSVTLDIGATQTREEIRVASSGGGAQAVLGTYAGSESYVGSTNNVPLYFRTNGTNSAYVDTSGRLLAPNQPAFNAIDGGSSNGSAYVLPFTTVVSNGGNHYNNSTYRFTAPVAGRYFFLYNGMSNAGYNRSRFKVNGSYVGNEFFSMSSTYAVFMGHIVLYLSVSDYVEVWNDVQSNSQGDAHGSYRAFTGFLIG